jgi:hypothetical protein
MALSAQVPSADQIRRKLSLAETMFDIGVPVWRALQALEIDYPTFNDWCREVDKPHLQIQAWRSMRKKSLHKRLAQ